MRRRFPVAMTFLAIMACFPLVNGQLRGGPDVTTSIGIDVEASGNLVVTDTPLLGVVRVDPVTGDRTIVSNSITGSGPVLVDANEIAVEASGDLVVVDKGSSAVVRVDPVTGDRTIVSDAVTGAGPLLVDPNHIAVEANGDLVVVDTALSAVVRVDPVTGDRTIVTVAGAVPTVSTWGILALLLLVLVAGTVVFRRPIVA